MGRPDPTCSTLRQTHDDLTRMTFRSDITNTARTPLADPPTRVSRPTDPGKHQVRCEPGCVTTPPRGCYSPDRADTDKVPAERSSVTLSKPDTQTSTAQFGAPRRISLASYEESKHPRCRISEPPRVHEGP